MIVDPSLFAGLAVGGFAFLTLAVLGWRQAFLAGTAFREEVTEHGYTRRRLEDVEALSRSAPWAATHRHCDGGLYQLEEEFVQGRFAGVTFQGVIVSGENGCLAWVGGVTFAETFTKLIRPAEAVARPPAVRYFEGWPEGYGIDAAEFVHGDGVSAPITAVKIAGGTTLRSVSDHWNARPEYDREGREAILR